MKCNVLKNFIVIEGLDGSGTSTQTKFLGEKLKNSYITFEPTNGNIGKVIRLALKKEIKLLQKSLIHLFIADRNEHLYEKNGIIERCKNEQIVISDRYLFSTLAYQSLDISFEEVFNMNSDFPLPEFVFFINTSPKECKKRITKRNEKEELFESENIQDKILNNYLKSFSVFRDLYDNMNIVFVDGSKTKKQISKSIFETLKFFNKV